MRLHCRILLAGLALLACATRAAAHTEPVAPGEIWSAWNPDPWILLAIGLAACAYAWGTASLRARTGRGRVIADWRYFSYCGGLLALFVALISPLDALGGSLFAAHMLQHELLIVVAAPLLVLGLPLLAWLWALPPRWRRRVGGVVRRPVVRSAWGAVSHPLAAWTLHAAAVLVWHAPALYQATLTSAPVHALQHLSFFGTALLFWWALLHPVRFRRLGQGLGVMYLFTTALYGSALGALLTFSPSPWYPIYEDRAPLWGFSGLEDQQLGGLIMWIPFGMVYTAVALLLFASWLRSMGPADPMRQRSAPA